MHSPHPTPHTPHPSCRQADSTENDCKAIDREISPMLFHLDRGWER
ncbi:MAG: hypothetical protein KME27_15295 [Lyngbya sp. HA4199-MV5]|nr:hypothetical protein [Lyngbya sp. HA4199-MV5]